jgi:hypothetical protein
MKINVNSWLFRTGCVAAAIIFAATSLAFSPITVYADSPTPTPQTQPNQNVTGANQRLEKAYQAELKLSGKQEENLDKAKQIGDKVQTWIDTLQGKGEQVGALRIALAVFRSQIVTAEASHRTAAGLLSRHPGFAADGSVTNSEAARATVKDARQALIDCHTVLRQASLDLRNVIKDWRQNHQSITTPSPDNSQGS